MYSDEVLDIVSASVDIYQRAPEGQAPRVPKRGHFECTDCISKPMGSRPRYFTGSLIDFQYTDQPMFNFLFSPNDLYYRDNRETGRPHIKRLARARHLDWTYLNASDVDGWELHVRGWWNHVDEFIHNTGMLDLGKHVDLDFDFEEEDRELGIQVYTPAQTGMYIYWENANVVPNWNLDQQYEKTFVHESMDAYRRIEMPLWNKRAIPKGTKKKKVKKKLTDATGDIDVLNTNDINDIDTQMVELVRQRVRGVAPDQLRRQDRPPTAAQRDRIRAEQTRRRIAQMLDGDPGEDTQGGRLTFTPAREDWAEGPF